MVTKKKTAKKTVATKKTPAVGRLAGWWAGVERASVVGINGETSDYVKVIAASGDKVLVALRPSEAKNLVAALVLSGARRSQYDGA